MNESTKDLIIASLESYRKRKKTTQPIYYIIPH